MTGDTIWATPDNLSKLFLIEIDTFSFLSKIDINGLWQPLFVILTMHMYFDIINLWP